MGLLWLSTTVLTGVAVAQAATISKPYLIVNPTPSNVAINVTSINSNTSSLQQPPRSPFIWYIHGTPLALNFSSYRRQIYDEDIISCYLAASKYIRRVIQEQGDGPIPPSLQLQWAHDSALFSVQHSSRMTYNTIDSVLPGLELFQLTYGYFELHFEIIHNTKGEIGSGDVRSTRPSTSSDSTPDNPQPENVTSLLLSAEANQNATLALSTSPNLTARPPSPFLWPIQGTSLRLNFTSFGGIMHVPDILTVYVAAAGYVRQVIQTHGNSPIPAATVLSWSHRTVSFTVEHAPAMTFYDLADVIGGLSDFQRSYGYTVVQFEIVDANLVKIGAGNVFWRLAHGP